jgi:hypothetical protein
MTPDEVRTRLSEALLRHSAPLPGVSHRYFTTEQAQAFIQEALEWIPLSRDPFFQLLCRALLATEGKYQSLQDRAAAILRLLVTRA